ncbi:hypothetical protein FZO89_00875 [Luteimonas viscosa]|uniref:XAC0095-like domain-containing protein n=1 Tax=Luteimonas viscosa TaxID=1132694 RepID=A0A5D4XJU3_9GAMM|nr:hypothetical protein [Luteimonas viscosa]TYT24948.1 hypothetical protein FZO89_00875 [Luteimonas viscosa]
MSKYELDEMDTTGYFLPEDTHFRLKKLQGHMEFLSQLAQPRRHDEEETNRGPVISGMDLAVCMELLAEQAEQVLDEVTWPAEREVKPERPQARDEDDLEDADEEEADEALTARAQDDDEAGDAPPASAGDEMAHAAGDASVAADADAGTTDPLVIGMTMDQLDALNRLHDRLHAYGDMVLGLERMNLADGTPTVLGEVIFEDAEAASKLMDQVAEQQLPDELRGKRRVREAHAAYGAPTGASLAFDASMSMAPPRGPTGWRTSAATLH